MDLDRIIYPFQLLLIHKIFVFLKFDSNYYSFFKVRKKTRE